MLGRGRGATNDLTHRVLHARTCPTTSSHTSSTRNITNRGNITFVLALPPLVFDEPLPLHTVVVRRPDKQSHWTCTVSGLVPPVVRDEHHHFPDSWQNGQTDVVDEDDN